MASSRLQLLVRSYSIWNRGGFTSPPMNFRGAPNLATAWSTRYSAASKQSSIPLGKGSSGASLYPMLITATFAPSAVAFNSGS